MLRRDLPKVGEPFDELSCIVLVELNVREVHFQHGRRRVADPEEHQFRLPEMHRGEGGRRAADRTCSLEQ